MTITQLRKSVAEQVLASICDRCGVRARSRARLAQHELFLCRHHTMEHGAALVKAGWDVIMPTGGNQ